MPVPKSLSHFISEDQWKALDLDALDQLDRDTITRALEAAFATAPSPEHIDPEEVSELMQLAKDMVEDFKEKLDLSGIESGDVEAANSTTEGVLNELNDGDDE